MRRRKKSLVSPLSASPLPSFFFSLTRAAVLDPSWMYNIAAALISSLSLGKKEKKSVVHPQCCDEVSDAARIVATMHMNQTTPHPVFVNYSAPKFHSERPATI